MTIEQPDPKNSVQSGVDEATEQGQTNDSNKDTR